MLILSSLMVIKIILKNMLDQEYITEDEYEEALGDDVYSRIQDINKEKNTTVILTTHDLKDIEDVCDRIILLDKGQIIFDGEKQKFKDTYGNSVSAEIILKNKKTSITEKLYDEDFEIVEENEKNIKIKFDHNRMTIVKIVEMISKYGDIVDIHMKEAELEDILKEIYKASDNGDKFGSLIYKAETKVMGTLSVEDKYINRVREGFSAVVQRGLGYGYMGYYTNSAGKTGTSQSFIDTDGDNKVDTETITSSFVGYSPSDNPRMSIVVVSPDVGIPDVAQSGVTKRISAQIVNKYFELNQ